MVSPRGRAVVAWAVVGSAGLLFGGNAVWSDTPAVGPAGKATPIVSSQSGGTEPVAVAIADGSGQDGTQGDRKVPGTREAGPQGRPRWPGGPRPGSGGPGGGGPGGGGPGGGPPAFDQVEDVVFLPGEQEKFEAFMAQRSPTKWKVFQSFRPDRPLGRRLRAGLVQRYRSLQQIASIDPPRYESEVAVIKIEDEVFGILQDQRQAGLSPQETDAKLRERAVALLEIRHNWRQVRLSRIKAELSDMKVADAAQAVGRELERESNGGGAGAARKVKDKQVDQLVERFKKSTAEGFRAFGRPLPGGERPPGWEGRPQPDSTPPGGPAEPR